MRGGRYSEDGLMCCQSYSVRILGRNHACVDKSLVDTIRVQGKDKVEQLGRNTASLLAGAMHNSRSGRRPRFPTPNPLVRQKSVHICIRVRTIRVRDIHDFPGSSADPAVTIFEDYRASAGPATGLTPRLAICVALDPSSDLVAYSEWCGRWLVLQEIYVSLCNPYDRIAQRTLETIEGERRQQQTKSMHDQGLYETRCQDSPASRMDGPEAIDGSRGVASVRSGHADSGYVGVAHVRRAKGGECKLDVLE